MSPVFARRAEPLPGLHRIAGLHGHIAEVHVGTLYPAAVRAGVLHRDGVSADGDDLAAALRGQRRVVLAADVYPLVHLLLRPVFRVRPHPEGRSDEQELLPFDRESVLRRGLRFPERALFHAEALALRLHLPHDLPVIALQPVLLDDPLQAVGIPSARGIARLFEALRPALVVVGREREAAGIAAVLLQEAGVVLVGFAHALVAAEFLVRFVVGI